MIWKSVWFFGAHWLFSRFFALARVETFFGLWQDLVSYFQVGHYSSGLQLLAVLFCQSQSFNCDSIVECWERWNSFLWSFESIGEMNLSGFEHCQCFREHIVRLIFLAHSSWIDYSLPQLRSVPFHCDLNLRTLYEYLNFFHLSASNFFLSEWFPLMALELTILCMTLRLVVDRVPAHVVCSRDYLAGQLVVQYYLQVVRSWSGTA